MTELSNYVPATHNPLHEHQLNEKAFKLLSTMCDSVEGWTLRNPLAASLVWIGILFGSVFCFYTPSYETNDDVIMSMIASGTGVSATPNEHLVFTNVAIGLLLKQLYTHIPSLPWYAYYLLSVNYLTHVAILHTLLTWRYNRAVIVSFLLLFATVGVQLITNLQFTSTAVWATECGLLVALSGLLRQQRRLQTLGTFAAGVSLMVLGSLVRFDSYLAAMAISAVPLAGLVWHLDRNVLPRSRVWESGLALIVVTQCAAMGLHAVHLGYYTKNSDWQAFLAFNPYRVKFNDYCWTSYSDENRHVFFGVNWTENDHAMIKSCFFDDPSIFGRDKLKPIIDGFSWGKNAFSLRKMTYWWKEILLNPLLWPIGMVIPFQIRRARDPGFAIRHLLLLTASIDAVILGLMLLKNPPARVYYPLFAFQPLYMLVLMRCTDFPMIGSEKKPIPNQTRLDSNVVRPPALFWRRAFIQASIVLAILGVILEQSLTFRSSSLAVSSNRQLRADLARIDPRDDELFICWGDRFPYESILPLESPDAWRSLHLYCLGWCQQSPINQSVKKRFGIDNLAIAMVENPQVYLLGPTETHRIPLDSELDHFQTFVYEHHKLNVKWRKQYYGDQVQIFKPASVVMEASKEPTVTRWK